VWRLVALVIALAACSQPYERSQSVGYCIGACAWYESEEKLGEVEPEDDEDENE